jgi:GNAT superfamily N-acetyltransferase
MEEIRIRAATVADMGHIVRHRVQMFTDMGKATAAELETVGVLAEEYLHEQMPAGRYRGWLAETADRRVIAGAGIAIVDWPASPDQLGLRRGWILNVFTEAEFRGRGIARRVMDAVIAWSRAEGLFTVSLHASEMGRPLYEKLGFRPTNEMRLRL